MTGRIGGVITRQTTTPGGESGGLTSRKCRKLKLCKRFGKKTVVPFCTGRTGAPSKTVKMITMREGQIRRGGDEKRGRLCARGNITEGLF